MPSYTLSIVLRQMTRPELVSTIKRTAEAVLDRGGLLTKLESLGTRALPHKMSVHGLVHRTGTYFIMDFKSPPSIINDLKEELGRDIDILRRNLFKVEDPVEFKCTLADELQPPAYRKDVKDMMRIASKNTKKPLWSYNSGLDYYPFQK